MGASRRWAGALASLALVATSVVAGAAPATADDGLSTGSSSRYVLDAEDTTVEATITLDLSNTTTDSRDGYYTYYDTYAVPVPAGAEEVRATSSGRPLDVDLQRTDDPSTRLARMSFPELRSGRSRKITLTFQVPGEKPRSPDSTRVGPGYATFAVYGLGDPGRNVVEAVAPVSMTFDSTSEEFSTDQQGDSVTYRVDSEDAEGFWAVVSFRDPDAADERSVDAAGTSFVLAGFKDDPEWADFVDGRVKSGIPALERLVGTPWPGGLQRVREDASPSLRGYDGWFDPTDDEIVIGERLDDDLILHELSHAWLSGDRFEERWIYEGLAQVVADRAVRRIKGDPADHPPVSRRGDDAVALNAWDGSADTRSTDVDGYAYPAAFTATSALLGDLDDEDFARVLASAITGERAYDPVGTSPPGGSRTSWSRWLDLVEDRGGVEDAPSVFTRWVLTPEQVTELAPRKAARTAYRAVDDGDGAWLPPEGLRDAMTRWDFDRAEQVLPEVASLGEPVRATQRAAAEAGLEVPAVVRAAYEGADAQEEYAALATSLPRAAGVITDVGDAARVAAAEHDPVTGLGESLLRVDQTSREATALLEAGDFDGAAVAADRASTRAAIALLVGVGVLHLVLLALVLLAVGGWLVVRSARRSEGAQHAGVAQGVGLHPLQVQELRDPLVVGAQQLDVDRRVDRLTLDGGEAVAREERRFEGQAEQPP